MITPYKLLALIGKTVIHPGGGQSTKELYELANFKKTDLVLEIGCGVGTGAIDMVNRYHVRVKAIDVDPDMVALAQKKIEKAGVSDKIEVKRGSVENLPYNDNVFDKVIIESVISLTNRDKSIKEVLRVCKRGGKIVDHEFIWKKVPPPIIKQIFVKEFATKDNFKDVDDWASLYRRNGLKKVEFTEGNFNFLHPITVIRDEGIISTAKILFKLLSNAEYTTRALRLLPPLLKVSPYLGYIVIAGEK